jgi:5-methylcytosine-specific restriction endonuclease McrA
MELIPRSEAASKKLPRYFTGSACRVGHVAERYVANCLCVVCHRIKMTSPKLVASRPAYRAKRRDARRAYLQKWRAAHKRLRKEKPLPDERERRRLSKTRRNSFKRRALLKKARCYCCTKTQFDAIYVLAKSMGNHEVDHVQPLALGGAHCLQNLQILTLEEHIKKTSTEIRLIIQAWRDRRRA